jgi:3-methyl-2-oxobutanoate hydroxymethyltransferase
MSIQQSGSSPPKRLTSQAIRRLKASRGGERIAMVTAYDATMARLVDEAGADAILVGDSLGMVVQGHESTLPVTLDHMIYHCAAVRRGLARSGGRAHAVGDMPFGSYQAGPEDGVRAAVRLVAEGGVEAVKLEGGSEFAEVVRRIVRAGVPVMGHLGLTPQSVHALGGYVIQGREPDKARQLLEDARILEEAGCYSLVLECIPAELARAVTAALSIPTIGIGAGPHCDGQVLVVNDLLGMDPHFKPKFVRRFASMGEGIAGAVGEYVAAVRGGTFPAEEHSFHAALRLVSSEPEEPGKTRDVLGAPV